MHPINSTIDHLVLGRRYDYQSEATKALLDDLIREGNRPILVIKFLRNELDISLLEAKTLYEGRKAFLTAKNDPFGWQ